MYNNNSKPTCLVISASNIQNYYIRRNLIDLLSSRFEKVYSVGDELVNNWENQIMWKGAYNRGTILNEPIIFFKLIQLFMKYKPSHTISFSPKVNIYCGLLSSLFKAKHIAVISGLGKYSQQATNKISLIRFLFWVSLGKAQAVVTMNDANFIFFKKLLDPQKISKIPSEGYCSPSAQKGKIGFSQRKILFLSRIIAEKGIFILLRAFEKLNSNYPNHKLIIAGELALDPKNGDLDLFSSLVDKTQSEYLGFIDDESKLRLLEDSHVVVLPSIYGEGLPMILLEAQSYGCIVVTTRVPGCVDAVAPIMNEFLCDYSEQSLYESLVKAISVSEPEMKRKGDIASKWVRENHDINNITELYRSLILKLDY
jgi:glycosyltransferase involved in cell wall biosynthesis